MKIILRLAVAFILIALTACTKDEFKPSEWGLDPELELSPLAVILTPSHLCDTVTVNTNYNDFSISAPYWVNVEKIEESSAIQVRANEFTGKDELREGYVTVKIQRGKKHIMTRDFVVIQFKENVFNY